MRLPGDCIWDNRLRFDGIELSVIPSALLGLFLVSAQPAVTTIAVLRRLDSLNHHLRPSTECHRK